MSTLVPFAAMSAVAKCVPVVCGAEEMFSGGAVAWMVEVGAREHSCLCLRLLDKKAQHLSLSTNTASVVISMAGS